MASALLAKPVVGLRSSSLVAPRRARAVAPVRAMADKGMAVLVISSELEELMAISDRILVLHGGRIAQSMNRRDVATEEELHHAIQGHTATDLGAA